MRSAACLVLLGTLAGCAATGSLFGRDSDARATSGGAPEGATIDAQGLAVYLELMRQLVGGDVVTQADTFADAADAVELAPTTTNRLKYALALAVPGHAGSDAAAAERRLNGLVADNTLLPAERVLAEIHLAEVSQRLVLDASAEQLRAELAEARDAQNADAQARLQAALEENRRLREDLEEATSRLEAITSIEQSIRERSQ